MARVVIIQYICPRCRSVMPFFAFAPYFRAFWVCASCRAKVALTDHLLGKLWGQMLWLWSVGPIALVILLLMAVNRAEVAAMIVCVPLGGLLLSLPFYGIGYVIGRLFVAESIRRRLRKGGGARRMAYREDE
jgi:hypothetical protein